MWCFTVLVGAVHNDSTVSVVSFDIAGTLKQKVGVALPASADLTSRESVEVLAADSKPVTLRHCFTRSISANDRLSPDRKRDGQRVF